MAPAKPRWLRRTDPCSFRVLILTTLLLALFLAAYPLSATAATCHLPGDHLTLQGCIDAIAEGDTVLVAPGVYIGPGNRDIHTDGKSITVIGEAGAETTIFDAEQTTRFFTFSAETEMTRVEGLTLRNGNGNPGGAVYIGSSVAGIGPSFANCRFIANQSGWGGAVMNEGDALVRFTRCHFEDNSAGNGGAILDMGYFIYSDVTLVDCTLIRNTAASSGGAIAEHSFGALNLSGCVFVDNGAQRGGALCLSNPIARPGPSASRLGRSPSEPDGALNEFGLVTECTFVSNEAQEGGAVVLFSFAPEFQRCLFTDNVAARGGAVSGTNGILIGCTLVGNLGDLGAAVYDDPYLPWFGHLLTNCIVAFNGPDQAIRRVDPEGCTYLRCCDIFGNEGGDWVGCIAGLLGTDGNISEDPAFCDTQGGDFTLHATSPCAPENSPAGCELIGALPVACGVTDVAADDAPSVAPQLSVSPNPVRGLAEFTFPGTGVRTLAIFDSQGRLVERLTGSAGRWVWTPGSAAPAGVYFARLDGGAVGEAVKFLYIR